LNKRAGGWEEGVSEIRRAGERGSGRAGELGVIHRGYWDSEWGSRRMRERRTGRGEDT